MLEKAQAEEEARVAAKKAREAAEAARKVEQEVKKLSQEEAQEAAGASMESLINKAMDFGAGLSWEKFSSQMATTIQNGDPEEKPKAQLATVRGQAKVRSLQPAKAVVKQTAPRSAASKPKQTEKPAEVRSVFGGLFKQETIYVDDD